MKNVNWILVKANAEHEAHYRLFLYLSSVCREIMQLKEKGRVVMFIPETECIAAGVESGEAKAKLEALGFHVEIVDHTLWVTWCSETVKRWQRPEGVAAV